MRSLLRFLTNNYFFLLFLLLEVISINLVLKYNNYQHIQFINASNRITGSLYNKYSFVSDYFSLKKTNREIVDENTYMKNLLQQISSEKEIDSLMNNTARYQYIPARVTNNTVNKQNNFITLNKGRRDGILPDMGIIGTDGIVGVITNVSDDYSTGYSVLTRKWKISAKIKKNNNLGSLEWDGKDYRMADLNEIPFHVELAVGDTIATSGYSPTYPEGVGIGKIENFNVETGDNFYHIKVRLFSNFMTLKHVYVVIDRDKEQIKELESIH